MVLASVATLILPLEVNPRHYLIHTSIQCPSGTPQSTEARLSMDRPVDSRQWYQVTEHLAPS